MVRAAVAFCLIGLFAGAYGARISRCGRLHANNAACPGRLARSPPELPGAYLRPDSPCSLLAAACDDGWGGLNCNFCQNDAACVKATGDPEATCSTDLAFAPTSEVRVARVAAIAVPRQ